LYEINGTSTVGYTVDQAVKKIRGPKGTPVEVTMLRKAKDGSYEKKKITLVREKIEMPTVKFEVKKIDNKDVAYIRISQFTSHTFEKMVEAVNQTRQNETVHHTKTQSYFISYFELIDDFSNYVPRINEDVDPILIEMIMPIIKDMENIYNGKFGRIFLIKLPQESDITPHFDDDEYFNLTRRFHLPIITNEMVDPSRGCDSHHSIDTVDNDTAWQDLQRVMQVCGLGGGHKLASVATQSRYINFSPTEFKDFETLTPRMLELGVIPGGWQHYGREEKVRHIASLFHQFNTTLTMVAAHV
jgi:hypothetical protein